MPNNQILNNANSLILISNGVSYSQIEFRVAEAFFE